MKYSDPEFQLSSSFGSTSVSVLAAFNIQSSLCLALQYTKMNINLCFGVSQIQTKERARNECQLPSVNNSVSSYSPHFGT